MHGARGPAWHAPPLTWAASVFSPGKGGGPRPVLPKSFDHGQKRGEANWVTWKSEGPGYLTQAGAVPKDSSAPISPGRGKGCARSLNPPLLLTGAGVEDPGFPLLSSHLASPLLSVPLSVLPTLISSIPTFPGCGLRILKAALRGRQECFPLGPQGSRPRGAVKEGGGQRL